jgi:hypothetical protein
MMSGQACARDFAERGNPRGRGRRERSAADKNQWRGKGCGPRAAGQRARRGCTPRRWRAMRPGRFGRQRRNQENGGEWAENVARAHRRPQGQGGWKRPGNGAGVRGVELRRLKWKRRMVLGVGGVENERREAECHRDRLPERRDRLKVERRGRGSWKQTADLEAIGESQWATENGAAIRVGSRYRAVQQPTQTLHASQQGRRWDPGRRRCLRSGKGHGPRLEAKTQRPCEPGQQRRRVAQEVESARAQVEQKGFMTEPRATVHRSLAARVSDHQPNPRPREISGQFIGVPRCP